MPDPHYQPIETVVLGAGLVGMATAAAYTGGNGGLLVLEKGAPDSYREATPSQGSLRGSRVVDQTAELTADIRRTWEAMQGLEARHGTSIMTPASVAQPYLMAVKDPEHFTEMQNDLLAKQSPFKAYTLGDAEKQFGIKLPRGYAGVINATESRVLDIDAYFDALRKEIAAHQGEIRHETTITGYGKLSNSSHLLELSDGTKYNARNLIVATGTDISQTLHDLRQWHDASHVRQPEVFAEPCEIPERFRSGSSVRVPQRTLHVEFDTDTHIRPVTLYNLDIDRRFTLADGETQFHPGHLGFYMFPEKKGLKIGYDPMASTIENPAQLDEQQELMLRHLSRTYGMPRDKIRVLRSHSCAYPLDRVHHPCMGTSGFHGIGVAGNFIGYGAMAAYGAATRMKQGHIAPTSRYHPDITPDPHALALWDACYGENKRFPHPPSDAREYGGHTQEKTL